MADEPSAPHDPAPADFGAWLGGTRRVSDALTLERARKLAAMLDLAPEGLRPGDALPPGWHWIYFHEPIPRARLGDDGHELRGDFLPPIPLERRMWAGGRLRFRRPLHIGDEVTRVSTIRSIREKEGRRGPLAFVTVEHRLLVDGDLALEEEQDLVYLNRPPLGQSNRADTHSREPGDEATPGGVHVPGAPGRGERFTPNEITLFRFSALTFNAHRIHYDRRYAVETEGYPDLVVHGPLLALLLLNTAVRLAAGGDAADGAAGAGMVFSYRALRPLFCGETVELIGGRAVEAGNGRAFELRARRPDGTTVMRASMTDP
ncbi:MAG: MaoC family dehydratase N-terminal domain-containing protein [Longimicrobiales bacterium]|nr:MaoC family dehydratase N-terminal domain-containing protein [Longimicrobiales bacterium]